VLGVRMYKCNSKLIVYFVQNVIVGVTHRLRTVQLHALFGNFVHIIFFSQLLN
jgi:hypothetical protein